MKTNQSIKATAKGSLRQLRVALNNAILVIENFDVNVLDGESMSALRKEVEEITQRSHELNAYMNVLHTN